MIRVVLMLVHLGYDSCLLTGRIFEIDVTLWMVTNVNNRILEIGINKWMDGSKDVTTERYCLY